MVDQMKAPRNTAREAEDDPTALLMLGIFGGDGKDIERQEAQGQASFVGSDTLPTQMGAEDEATLERFGVKFHSVVEGDPLFQYATLPAGWSKKQTNHSMWSKLVDDKGRERAAMFYKAAFYDRGAHLQMTRRFEPAYDYDREKADRVATAVVLDCGAEVFRTDPKTLLPDDRENWEANGAMKDAVRAEAEAWLDTNYPDWKSAAAYWE